MVEIRNVQNDAPTSDGALAGVPGAFMMHAVGDPADDPDSLERALRTVVAAAEPADSGLAIGSWMDGRAAVPDALPPEVRERVRRIASSVDPGGVIARPPVIA